MLKRITVASGIIGILAVAGTAFAQTASTTVNTAVVTTTPTIPSQQMVLSVGTAGKVLLRGTIESATATSITVKSWGGDWTINIPTSAEVLPQGAALSSFQTGDFVGVQGTINQSGSWTVDATIVRDWTARQAMTQEIKTNVQAVQSMMAGMPRTIQGALSNLNASAQTFTLTDKKGAAYSVSMVSGAKLLANNWLTLDFSKVNNGDTVRVYGTVASSTVSGTIFRDVSVK